MKYDATIEYLEDQGAAIVTLHDEGGEWSGSGRVEVRTRERARAALYEEGYRLASLSARSKGGTLDRFFAVN